MVKLHLIKSADKDSYKLIVMFDVWVYLLNQEVLH